MRFSLKSVMNLTIQTYSVFMLCAFLRKAFRITDSGYAKSVQHIEALIAERGEADKLWGSMVKQALKRRKPGFNESYFGFRTFSQLLKDGQRRGQLKLESDQPSGGYIIHLPPHDD